MPRPPSPRPLNARPLNAHAQPPSAQPPNAQPPNAQPPNAQPPNARPLNTQPLNTQAPPLNARRPRGWALRLAALLALGGCADFDASGGIADDTGPGPADRGPDADAGGCPPDTWLWDGRCLGLPPAERLAVCAYVAALDAGCEDLDGDCRPGRCARDLPAPIARALLDCDDTSLTIHPGAPERCSGPSFADFQSPDADEDCDGITDEGYAFGPCEACAQPGQRACDPRDDQAPTRCQPDLPLDEVCNGDDDDCDGRADEACRLPLPEGVVPHRAAICAADHLLLADAAGGLHRLRRDPEGAWQTTAVPTDGRAVDFPACDGDLAAWLASPPPAGGEPAALTCGPGGDPGAIDDPARAQAAPWICQRASVFSQIGAAAPRELAGLEQPGPPVVDGDRVRWHSLVEGAPVLKEAERGQPGIATLFGGQALSDATRAAADRLALRAWSPDAPPRLVVRDLRPESPGDLMFSAPPGAPLPPALSARWLVHARDTGALWALDLEGAELTGFQFTARPGPHRAPTLRGDHVYWIDASEPRPALRGFDLQTGVEQTLAADLPPEVHLTAGPGLVAWTTPGAPTPTLRLDPQDPPEPPTDPDAGPGDAGPEDAGAPDADPEDASAEDTGAPDASPDAHREDAALDAGPSDLNPPDAAPDAR